MNMIDCHTHTVNSPDASSSPDEMVCEAYKKNLSAYAITDHCEINRWFSIEHYGYKPNDYDTYDFGRDFEKSMQDTVRLKAEYDGKLNLLCGTELGQAQFDFGLADSVVKDKRLDFVIGSVHQIEGWDDFAFIDYGNYDIKKLLTGYFEDIYRLCKWDGFDILAHLTYPLRYIVGEKKIPVDMSPYEEIIIESFKVLISNGKGIEINTSGFRQAYRMALPDLHWVKLFKEVGGEILSIGSDAHCTQDLGKNLAEGIEIAKMSGFDRLCFFKERKPNFISI